MKFDDLKRNARSVRNAATDLSTAAPLGDHLPNEDEQPPYVFSFTKGLAHKLNGLLEDPDDFLQFRDGTVHHDPTSFAATQPYRGGFPGAALAGFEDPLDAFRRWESPTAGHAYVLQGPDPYAVTQPPAPEIGSAEFAAEVAEVYEMALGRDWTVAACMPAALVAGLKLPAGSEGGVPQECLDRIQADHKSAAEAAVRLSQMRWFRGTADDMQGELEKERRRHGEEQTPGKLFRGVNDGAGDTPFLSQFMVMGSGGDGRDPKRRASGYITYGAQRIPQQVRVAVPGVDYMTGWRDYLNVQNGLNARRTLPPTGAGAEFVDGQYRPLARLRDLATYVHDDQLYQAYLNAALIMLDEGYALDLGIPYHRHPTGGAKRKFPFPGAMPNDTNQMPFALFGPPHLLTLVTEVSSRALKAVRLQKFSVHRRLRPEAAGALFHTVYSGYEPHWDDPDSAPYGTHGNADEVAAQAMLASTVAKYTFPQTDAADGSKTVHGSEPILEEILTLVREHNAALNGPALKNSWLLPMAFPEGSPMHPAYGAGHATVAGACVTLLKAFFAMRNKDGTPVYVVEPGGEALVPASGEVPEDLSINLLAVDIPQGLTLEGELNKLMWNISNGRNIAGVHYYTDYIESALLGEAVTIGILREQMLAYHKTEQVEMDVPLLVRRTLPEALLSGSDLTKTDEVKMVRICSDGSLAKLA